MGAQLHLVVVWSKPTIPCPLCGVRECVAQHVIDVSAIGNKCTAFISGKKACTFADVWANRSTHWAASSQQQRGGAVHEPAGQVRALLLDSAVLFDGGALHVPEVARWR